MRSTISISTFFTVFWTLVYHRYETQIHKFDNTLECTNGNISKKVWVLLEISVVLIHPPWRKGVTYFFLDFHHLYFTMILRIFYTFRVVMLHSHLFDSPKVQAIATLNKISIGALTNENIRLILRVLVGEYGGRVLVSMIVFNWFFIAWLIRLSESVYNHQFGTSKGVHKYSDALWMSVITFTTIGYIKWS